MQVFRKSALAVAITTALQTQLAHTEELLIQEGETQNQFTVTGATDVTVDGTVISEKKRYNYDEGYALQFTGAGLNSTLTLSPSGYIAGADNSIFVHKADGHFSLSNSGHISRPYNENYYYSSSAISIKEARTIGHIENDVTGTIIARGHGIRVSYNSEVGSITNKGYIASSNESISLNHNSRITGDLINEVSGTIHSYNDTALRVSGNIDGSIINNGFIGGLVDDNDSIHEEISRGYPNNTYGYNGIYTDYNAQITGDIINTGSITVENSGIRIYYSQIDGGIYNTGRIVSGDTGISYTGNENDFSNLSITNAEGATISSNRGLYIDGAIVDVTNNGRIDNNNQSVRNYNYDYSSGIYTGDGSFINSITNNGSINSIYGIDSSGRIAEKITNNGVITAVRTGIQSHGETSNIINNGLIRSETESGISIIGNSSIINVINNGNIESSSDNGYGIDIEKDVQKILNTGNIYAHNAIRTNDSRITNFTNEGLIDADLGIDIFDSQITSFVNSGTIDADNGVEIQDSFISTLDNTGSINSENAIFSYDSSISRINNSGEINARNGINIIGGASGRIVNNGNIQATSSGISISHLTDTTVDPITGENITEKQGIFFGDIINSGSITLSGNRDNKGIAVEHTYEGDIVNSGTISASAPNTLNYSYGDIDTNINNYIEIVQPEYWRLFHALSNTKEVSFYNKDNTDFYGSIYELEPGFGWKSFWSADVDENQLMIFWQADELTNWGPLFVDPQYIFTLDEQGRITNEVALINSETVERIVETKGIYIASNLDGNLINTGTIDITSGTGIHVESGHISGSVINTGTLSAPTAVDFRRAIEGQTLEQNAGLLSGDIYGSQLDGDILIARGGQVTGNIIDFEQVEISGDVTWAGQSQNGNRADSQSHSFTIADSGNLTLLQPTVIDADYVQSGTVNIAPSDNTVPYIQVTGSATLDDTATINITPETYEEITWQILSAEDGLSISDNVLQLTSDSVLFSVNQFIEDATLNARISYNNISDVVITTSGNSNLAAFATSFQSALSTASDATQTAILGQLNQVRSAEEFAALVSSELPGLDNETQTALLSAANAVQDGAFNNILSHLSDLRNSGSGVGTGDLPYSGGVWVKALHTEADQGEQRDGGTTYNGYKARSKGFTLGGDIELSPEWTLGTAFSFADVTVNVKDSGNNTTMDSYQLSLYGDWQRNNWFANGILNVGYNNVDSKRYAGSTRYEADYGSKQFGVNVTGGYQFWFNDKDTLIEPQLALNYSLLDTNSYKETSQSGDVVEVSPHNQEVIELGAGVRLSQLIETDRGPLLPEARLFAYHDFKADKVTQSVTAEAFNLPLSFRTVGIEPEKTRYQAGLGVSYWMDNDFSLSLNYDHTWQSDFKADSVQAKVRYDF